MLVSKVPREAHSITVSRQLRKMSDLPLAHGKSKTVNLGYNESRRNEVRLVTNYLYGS